MHIDKLIQIYPKERNSRAGVHRHWEHDIQEDAHKARFRHLAQQYWRAKSLCDGEVCNKVLRLPVAIKRNNQP